MKRILSALVVTSAIFATVADAGSIGRSGGSSSSGGRSSSSSFSSASRSSYSAPSAPSKPAVAPAPSKPGGIGGTTSSVGVRKSEVTNGVRNDVAATKPATGAAGTSGTTHSSGAPHYTPSPGYGYAPVPQPQVTNGSVFMSSLGGSFLGSWIGSSIGNHNSSGGTTVINNGGGSSGTAGAVGPSAGSIDSQFNPGGVSVQPKKEYGVWSFIADLIGFVFVVAILLGIAWLLYKGFQMVRNYVNKERGVSNIPFQPNQKFWEIQKAFAAADVDALQNLLGPDVIDELTNGLTPSTLTLHNVSHEVRLANNTEFSIWYRFEDDGAEVNQVWHYEKFGGGLWKLNGIENV